MTTALATAPESTGTTSNDITPAAAPATQEVTQTPASQVGTQVVSGDATVPAKTWRDELPAELKTEKSLESLKDIPSLAKSYVESQKMIGGSIRIPDAKDEKRGEKMTEIYRKLGVPEKVDDYKLAAPIIAKGVELTDGEIKSFAEAAHKANISPEQAQHLLNYYGETVKAAIPNYEADAKTCVENLKGEWGAGTERNMGVARRALFQVFGREVASKVETTNLGNDPSFIKGMYNLGKMLIEEGTISKEVAVGFNESDARTELAKLATADVTKHPYYVKEHPEHDSWVNKVLGWRQMMES